jgi:hypothetical protein
MSERDFSWAEKAAETPYTRVPVWVTDREDLTIYERAAYLAVARFISRAEGAAWAGIPRLARTAGCGETKLREGMKGLEDKGILSVERRGLNQTNRYKLRFTDPGPVSRGSGTSPLEDQEPRTSEDQEPQPLSTNQTSDNQTSRNQTTAAARANDDVVVVPPTAPLPPELDAAAVALARAGMAILDPTILVPLQEAHPTVDIGRCVDTMVARYRGQRVKRPYNLLRALVEADDAPRKQVGRDGRPKREPRRPTREERERWAAEDANAPCLSSDGDVFAAIGRGEL